MRHKYLYAAEIAFCLSLFLMAFLMDSPREIISGMQILLESQDVLISDYFAMAGPGAAFFNSGLVTLSSLILKWVCRDPHNGTDIMDLGLMAGFSLFGKNILNIWPILLGSWLFSRIKREPFKRYVSIALLATALSPLVSFAGLTSGWDQPLLGLLLGMVVGFVVPPLSAYTYRIQNGMNLYNMGFACGLLAMVIVPLLNAFGINPRTAQFWATGYNLPLTIYMVLLCLAMIATGILHGGKAARKDYWHLVRHMSGRSPSDFVRMFGYDPTLINMGINGLISTAFILATGGDLNGPTVGCIMTVIAFSAMGKHARNIVPIMLGVLLGSQVFQFSINDPAVQIAALLCTTLAPISGTYGWPFGILAGFLHSALVLKAGSVAEGINLYNNGFSGGLLAIVLCPVITSLFYHRRVMLQDKEYLDIFLGESHQDPDKEEKDHSHDIEMPY